MQIKDKRVIVTGAAGGLGMTISRELLRNGASVIAMIDIEEVAGKEAMNVLNAEFGRNRAIFFQCDVANNSEFDDTFKRAVKTLGGLEILVNNAGVINESDFNKTIDVNVTAVIRATLLGIQQMQKDSGGKGGVIVNISSVAGLYSLSQLPVYSATKHAVVSFSRSFAQPYHYERTGVRIIVLCPELSQMSNVKNSEANPSQDQLIQKYFRRVDSVAHGLVYVVRCAQNGSIWISEDGKPVYEIQLFDSLPQKHNESILEENERKMQID
ncbi:15-hydroxyprostaglandin dehydrogenase [NAD(+)] isoform X1 [Bombus terrestris]|uniref:15-hydroxyprostaglandin dehydrogenase [NAD(+)] n=1 Tax=Bombus terrestris TaxID=30195 RepID=A0A9B2JJ65_BOMTE|nr:15-hydroxyprostaglandin dehydrogenase [NAD(+)] isoform X1 [Bombus terrestris]